ncbi:hypothetical protein SAOR_11985 [Salinisphaera orenii MK-B5]|uniref:HK97 gp10 family phage protein n=1 Tax=Salinisphaera orenii MK-B5 TaxID=856730 RepID=A0A423PJ11_9GAMM|nr:hypothetical protein [Salinisphaera orenii]ROO25579.1 hypothetical protein SAOR_11985 [Salinisphaera orenii MK-B5]
MSFARDVDRFVKKTEKRIEHAHKSAATKLITDVIDDTPQDTGFAAANWRSGVGNAPDGPVDRTSAAEAKAEALAAIAAWPMGTRLEFANAAPYILSLEFGSSNHRPAGMVRRNVKQFSRNVKRAAKRGA